LREAINIESPDSFILAEMLACFEQDYCLQGVRDSLLQHMDLLLKMIERNQLWAAVTHWIEFAKYLETAIAREG
jgi:hypothetical protein